MKQIVLRSLRACQYNHSITSVAFTWYLRLNNMFMINEQNEFLWWSAKFKHYWRFRTIQNCRWLRGKHKICFLASTDAIGEFRFQVVKLVAKAMNLWTEEPCVEGVLHENCEFKSKIELKLPITNTKCEKFKTRNCNFQLNIRCFRLNFL